MNKKETIYLKIEDWDLLRSTILDNLLKAHSQRLVDYPLMRIMSELGKHALDVIEFEEVVTTIDHGLPKINLPTTFRDGEEVHVFVVRKEEE